MTVAVAENFRRDVAHHQMAPFCTDGLYRHLRFRDPKHGFYWFDIVTWPGTLAINGDMGTFVFSRTRDMFEFFRGNRINPSYWAEKLQAPEPRGAKVYDEDHFRQLVIENFIAAVRGGYAPRGLGKAVRAEILDREEAAYEDGAYTLLLDFKHDGFRFEDSWEWDLRTYSYQFLWCCHAIVWGIAKYGRCKAAVR